MKLDKMKLNEKKPFFAKSSVLKKPLRPSKLTTKAKLTKDVIEQPALSLDQEEGGPVTLEEYFKEQEKHVVKGAMDEKEKICSAVRDERFPNFLTKLGLITGMIEDVTQFRIRLKRSQSRMASSEDSYAGMKELKQKRRKKKTDESETGPSVEATEAIWKMKKKGQMAWNLEDKELADYKKPLMLQKSKNKLGKLRGRYSGSNSRKKSQDKDELPTCYGYQYLYAVDAIDDEGRPDIEIFQEYFSDLSDDKLSLQLSDIIRDCSASELTFEMTSMKNDSCPDPRESRQELRTALGEEYIFGACQEACLIDSDCGQAELCCINSCGGHTCYKSKSKWAYSIARNKSRSLCQEADQMLKCLYDKLKHRICTKESGSDW